MPLQYYKSQAGPFPSAYGDIPGVIEAAEGLGYYSIQWDADSLDWKDNDSSAIISRVTSAAMVR